jgi:hypothetical protein
MIERIAPLAIALVFAAAGCSGNNDRPASAAVPQVSVARASDAGAAARRNVGSGPNAGDADAIRAAIENHLRENRGINMAAMDMTVDSVSVSGDQARAHTVFRVKNGGTGMSMIYFLKRHPGGWIVVRSQPGDGQFVHPPLDATHSGLSPSHSAPGMPDVNAFLKNHPARKGN